MPKELRIKYTKNYYKYISELTRKKWKISSLTLKKKLKTELKYQLL